MRNEELKKGSAVTEFDELTDEQLEAVPGGDSDAAINGENIFSIEPGTQNIGIDGEGNSIYTLDNK